MHFFFLLQFVIDNLVHATLHDRQQKLLVVDNKLICLVSQSPQGANRKA